MDPGIGPDVVHGELHSDLLGIEGGPLLGTVDEAGFLLTDLSGGIVRRPCAEADLVQYVDAEQVFATAEPTAAGLLVIVETLSGTSQSWTVPVIGWGSSGPPELIDLVGGNGPSGQAFLGGVLLGDDGLCTLVDLSAERSGESWTVPAEPILYVDRSASTMITQLADTVNGPACALHHLGSAAAGRRLPGTLLDAVGGRLMFLIDGRLCLRSSVDGQELDGGHVDGHVSDGRFLRDSEHLLVVVTADGRDQALLVPADKSAGDRVAEAGRIRIGTCSSGGLSLHLSGALEASRWYWRAPSGEVTEFAGRIPDDRRLGVVTHRWIGPTPMLTYRPPAPTSAVIAIHGGPERFEQDELRYDGLYRWLLASHTAVVGINYAGSTGYGDRHRRRSWNRWLETFTDDLAAAVRDLAEVGLGPADTVLLGGSFGASLALLAASHAGPFRGVLVCSPVADLEAHAARLAAENEVHRRWFDLRFARSYADFGLDRLSACPVPVEVIHGLDDDVVDTEAISRLVARARAAGGSWTLTTEPGVAHTPGTAAEATARQTDLRSAFGRLRARAVPSTAGSPDWSAGSPN